MGEVDETQYSVHQGVPECYERVEAPPLEGVQYVLNNKIHSGVSLKV